MQTSDHLFKFIQNLSLLIKVQRVESRKNKNKLSEIKREKKEEVEHIIVLVIAEEHSILFLDNHCFNDCRLFTTIAINFRTNNVIIGCENTEIIIFSLIACDKRASTHFPLNCRNCQQTRSRKDSLSLWLDRRTGHQLAKLSTSTEVISSEDWRNGCLKCWEKWPPVVTFKKLKISTSAFNSRSNIELI